MNNGMLIRLYLEITQLSNNKITANEKDQKRWGETPSPVVKMDAQPASFLPPEPSKAILDYVVEEEPGQAYSLIFSSTPTKLYGCYQPDWSQVL